MRVPPLSIEGVKSAGGQEGGLFRDRRSRDPRHDPARRPRPDGAQQAFRPRGAGRIGHDGPSRRHVAIARQ